MTGRELIIYIMQNGLEDEEVIKNGVFVGLISEDEVASRFGVGINTVKVWHALGRIEGHRINGYLRFRKDIADPRKN